MKFIELKNITRKDSPIHYINEYHGDLQYENDSAVFDQRIEIIIEKTAFGTTNVQIHLEDRAPKALRDNTERLIEFVNEKYKDGYFEE